MINWDRYLDPPDEPEAVFCDDCGNEMEIFHDWDGAVEFRCRNRYCPSRFNDGSVEKEMAILILDQLDTIRRMKERIRRLGG